MKSEPLRQVAAAACAVAACTILVLAAGPARAADPDPSPTPPSPSSTTTYDKVADKFALTVSPTRIAVSQDRIGETQELLVVNQGEAPLTVTVQKRDFTGAPDGTMVFAEDAPYSASSWVTLEPTTFTVPPGGTQTVTAVVRVAPHAEPGDHQVAFVFLVPALKTSDNITINRGVGVPMYVTVPGPTDDSVTLTGLSASSTTPATTATRLLPPAP